MPPRHWMPFVAAASIAEYIAADGTLMQPVTTREIPGLVKAGTEALLLAAGLPTQHVLQTTPDDWRHAIMTADPETKLTLIKGLKAVRALRQRQSPAPESS